VANGSGTVASANVMNVAVTCVTNTYSLGGSVHGLVGSGLVLTNEGTTVNVSAAGTFAFGAKVPSGSSYAVTITSQPTGPPQTCTATSGSGTIGSADVNNIIVDCTLNGPRFAYVSSRVGIFCYSIDTGSGALVPLQAPPCASGELHGFATEPRGKFGYATDAVNNQIIAYSIDQSSGALAPIPGAQIATGSSPLDVHVDPSGRFAYVGNYGSNNISGYSIDSTSGQLAPMPGSPYPGVRSSPRLTIDASGKFVYAANNGPNTPGAGKGVSGFTVDSTTGALTPIARSPFDTPNYAMDVAVDPATRFLFATIPAMNAIAAYSINPTTGDLTPVPGSPFSNGSMPLGTGTYPVGISLDLTGKFLYATNPDTYSISGYAVDAGTGALTPVAGSPFPCPAGPLYLNVSPQRGLLVVSGDGNGTVATFSIDSQTGALTQVTGSPVAAGGAPGVFTIAFGQ
jgi:6-phosphogluconolactonase (cycloisomerase 2 family)